MKTEQKCQYRENRRFRKEEYKNGEKEIFEKIIE